MGNRLTGASDSLTAGKIDQFMNVSSVTPAREAGLRNARSWWTHTRRSFFWMVLIAFALRFGYILIARTYTFPPHNVILASGENEHFSFGWEMGRIGRSLALGEGFANPFNEQTGPTAWEPPLYPFLIGGVFKVFGVYSHASGIVLLSLNSIFSSLTCIPILLIARRCFGKTVAAWSGWLWVVLPPIIYWCTRFAWETSLAALLLATIFWSALTMEEREGFLPWLQFGLLWGVAGLTNTSLLSFLPVSGLWAWYRRARVHKRSFSGVILASAVFAACITPWVVRNYFVFREFIPIRSNFGVELRLGNGPGANGTWMEFLHPTENVAQMRLYRELGEIRYDKRREHEAFRYIRKNRLAFAVLSLHRFVYYWAGLPHTSDNSALAPFRNSFFLASSVLAFWGLGRALRLHKPGAWLFFWLILLFPLVYYLVFPHPRYRHSIEPELLILIVYVISEAETWKNRTNLKPGGA